MGIIEDGFSNPINQDLIRGKLPLEELLPIDIAIDYLVDIEKEAKKGMVLIENYPEMVFNTFNEAKKYVKEFSRINPDYFYLFNSLINAQIQDDYLSIEEIQNNDFTFCPVVTELDKIIWCIIYFYDTDDKCISEYVNYDTKSMLYAWIYILRKTQEMEIKFNRTLQINRISSGRQLVDLFLGNAHIYNVEGCHRPLSDKEKHDFAELDIKRKKIINTLPSYIRLKKQIEKETESEWLLFLDIINDLSKKEKKVVLEVTNKSASGKDKEKTIRDYLLVIDEIHDGFYTINNKRYYLIPIFDKVMERMIKTPASTQIRVKGGTSFCLHPDAFVLITDPKTFNYMFMSYHLFRLEVNQENAVRFTTVASVMIRRNLGLQVMNNELLVDVIKDFHDVVVQFIKENQHEIEQLSFTSVLDDAALVDSNQYDSMIIINQQDKELKEELLSVLSQNQSLDAKKIEYCVNDSQGNLGNYEEINTAKLNAQRLIISLNIIYLFQNALRIILYSSESDFVGCDYEQIKRYRDDLRSIDYKLIQAVYKNLGFVESGLLEYRERKGLNTETLSEYEKKVEEYRNSVFSETLKESILKMVENLSNQNIEQLMETQKHIRQEINLFPDCGAKKQFTIEWIDSISEEINKRIIYNSKQSNKEFEQYKESLSSIINKQIQYLPDTAIDSLATAELLYCTYATEAYSYQGFDYSCISALYYQAFEYAYNELVWKKYADYLNEELCINDCSYRDILKKYKGKRITEESALGYLDSDAKNRSFYIEYSNDSIKVKRNCMYKSFGYIIREIKPESSVPHFCDFFAKLSGFSNDTEMFHDQQFIDNCQRFSKAILDSTIDRNNASHGGTLIDLLQCNEDRKTVLSDIEQFRKKHYGLIHQLLSLLY